MLASALTSRIRGKVEEQVHGDQNVQLRNLKDSLDQIERQFGGGLYVEFGHAGLRKEVLVRCEEPGFRRVGQPGKDKVTHDADRDGDAAIDELSSAKDLDHTHEKPLPSRKPADPVQVLSARRDIARHDLTQSCRHVPRTTTLVCLVRVKPR